MWVSIDCCGFCLLDKPSSHQEEDANDYHADDDNVIVGMGVPRGGGRGGRGLGRGRERLQLKF